MVMIIITKRNQNKTGQGVWSNGNNNNNKKNSK